VLGLLCRMGCDLLAVTAGGGVGGLPAQTGEGLGRVAILTGVAGQLLLSQLTRRPPHVEGMLEHVVAGATLLDPIPNRSAHSDLSFHPRTR
jgi:hypothetical protein